MTEKQAKLDRISSLPWHVLDAILVNLPLRDAARTSILSTKWRYKWTGLSQFVFDDKCFPNSLSAKARWDTIMKIIHQVQSSHSGLIEKFKLAAYCLPNHSDLNKLILDLTEKGIKEIILQDFVSIKRFKLPSCLFSCRQLSCLELFGCTFKLPSTFKGFNCLKSLQLSQVSIVSDTLETLIRNCPALERLTLLDVDHLTFLRIHNHNLKYLKIDSRFEDISLENSVHLAIVSIRKLPMRGRSIQSIQQQLEQGKPCNLVRVFGSLYNVKRLTLFHHVIEFLASDKVPEKLPTMLNSILFLELKGVNFSSLEDVMTSFSILRSCPNLEELVITVVTPTSSRPIVNFIKAQCLCDFLFNRLKVVRIGGIAGRRSEWELIKLVLAHSPLLEEMTVVAYAGERIPLPLLLQVERLSEHVKITSLEL